jgi:hypothetical protein
MGKTKAMGCSGVPEGDVAKGTIENFYRQKIPKKTLGQPHQRPPTNSHLR